MIMRIAKRKWDGGVVGRKYRKIKGRLEDRLASERVKSELTEWWVRKEYDLGFVRISVERPLDLRNVREIERKRRKGRRVGM